MSLEGKENSIDPVAVRAELKAWETAFKEQNGRKAGREDIKKDATIRGADFNSIDETYANMDSQRPNTSYTTN